MPRNRKNLAQLVEELQNCHENSELEFKEAQKQLPKNIRVYQRASSCYDFGDYGNHGHESVSGT